MLTEIRSEQFRARVIKFGPSLNVVLGDDNATNSIGKSSLLMVIDFAFGGSSLLEHNKDIVHELGDHDYYFTFEFQEKFLNSVEVHFSQPSYTGATTTTKIRSRGS